MSAPRLHLSAPHLSGDERALVADALDSGWLAPLGPHVAAFEREVCARVGAAHACALASGTAALHLALHLLGVGPGDPVVCSTLTFAASANPIRYLGGAPVFVDADPATWNMHPGLLDEALTSLARAGTPARAAVVVDLYGQCADWTEISSVCARHGVPLIEDAAEALGATHAGRSAGCFGELAVLSFNGNKIVTATGGGMLLTPHAHHAARALHLATQAREPAPHYQHAEVGFNYRLSNVLAAIGRGQLRALDDRVAARRQTFDYYVAALRGVPGLEFMPEARNGRSTRWLSCITLDPARCGLDREALRVHLDAHDIEARPVWKPMHLQPAFAGCRSFGGAVSEQLFKVGLCLPSGSGMTDDDRARVVDAILAAPGLRRG